MIRKRLNIVPSSSIFPFLSVLACAIGVLALMLGMLAPGHAEVRSVELSAEQLTQYSTLAEDIEFADIDIDRLAKRYDAAEDVHSQLEKAELQLAELQKRHTEEQQRMKSAAERRSHLLSQADTLKLEIERLEPRLQNIEEKTKRLEADLEERRQPRPDPANRIRQYLVTRGIAPVFVECRSEGVVLYEADEPLAVPLAGLRKNPDYLALLDRVASTPEGVVVFMVRSDAVPTYFAARDVAREESCRNGKLPLPGTGPIDLSQVKKQFETEQEE
jgi:hypothetical protein